MWSSDWQHWRPQPAFPQTRWKTNARNAELCFRHFFSHRPRTNFVLFYGYQLCCSSIFQCLIGINCTIMWFVVDGGSSVQVHGKYTHRKISNHVSIAKYYIRDSQKNAVCIHHIRLKWKISQEITPLRWVCVFCCVPRKWTSTRSSPAFIIYQFAICLIEIGQHFFPWFILQFERFIILRLIQHKKQIRNGIPGAFFCRLCIEAIFGGAHKGKNTAEKNISCICERNIYFAFFAHRI